MIAEIRTGAIPMMDACAAEANSIQPDNQQVIISMKFHGGH
jgi:hypothetical protein